jgi:predicted AAA+ superfamily ATPase
MTDALAPNPLARIADALERLSPPPPAPPRVDAPAYVWDGVRLAEVERFAPVPIDLLSGIDGQRDLLLENTRRLASGAAAHDVLLWGARGSGKSALVKSAVGALQGEGAAIALVELPATAIGSLPALFGTIRHWPRSVVVFIDDLAFDQTGDGARLLRSVLEGGAAARPESVRLYVTSNRRHIVPRNLDEQASAINVRDVVDDNLALADRFGLSLGFHVCDQDTWLAIVSGYAERMGLGFDPGEALTWCTQRGARSGRVAWHYVVELAGRAGVPVTLNSKGPRG